MNLRDSTVRWRTFDAARVGLKPYAIEQNLETDHQNDPQPFNPNEFSKQNCALANVRRRSRRVKTLRY